MPKERLKRSVICVCVCAVCGFYTVLNSFHRRECQSQVGHLSSFYLFIYLAASGLGCVMWDLLLQGTDSLVVAHGLSCSVARGILVSPPGIKIHVSCIARRILNQWTTREIPGHNSSHCSFSSKCSWLLSLQFS